MFERIRLQVIGACAVLLLTSCSQDAKQQIRNYQLGERIQLGQFIYTVFEAQWLTQAGEAPNVRVPQNRFFLVRLSITNAGSADNLTPPISVVDPKGGAIAELSNGDGIPNWIGQLRQIKPANTTQGNLVFDVPPAHYRLRITDENEQNIALVDIPLSFESQAPPLGIPTKGDAAPQGAIRSPR